MRWQIDLGALLIGHVREDVLRGVFEPSCSFLGSNCPGSAFRSSGRAASGDPPENRAGNQAGPARVVDMKDASDHLAAGIEPRNGPPIRRDDSRALVDLEPAEGESDPAGGGISDEWR